jgi:hypothetical protein
LIKKWVCKNVTDTGSSDPHKAHLIVLPHISFYYAVLWAYAWVSVPYVLSLTKGNFIFNFDEEKPIGFKKIKNMLYNNKFRYYLSFLVIILIVFFAYISSEASTNWFKVRYIYSYSIGSFGFIFTSLAVYVNNCNSSKKTANNATNKFCSFSTLVISASSNTHLQYSACLFNHPCQKRRHPQ